PWHNQNPQAGSLRHSKPSPFCGRHHRGTTGDSPEEVFSDYLITLCCIGQLSRQDLSGWGNYWEPAHSHWCPNM
ncbi:MAG: hypothetical protein WCA19_21120, partial [Candidatus Acidiferrales bacterium]